MYRRMRLVMENTPADTMFIINVLSDASISLVSLSTLIKNIVSAGVFSITLLPAFCIITSALGQKL